ncbi:MAG: PAS-domain containing protein [Sphingobacteriia bacterium]|nr:PAS-domain containing protein [Sphingobacteriia bacterium]
MKKYLIFYIPTLLFPLYAIAYENGVEIVATEKINEIYKISILCCFGIIIFLAGLLIKKLIAHKELLNDFQKLHKLTMELPDKPTCGYIFVNKNDNNIFFSPTFLKRVSYGKKLDNLENLEEYFTLDSYNKILKLIKELKVSFERYNENVFIESNLGDKLWLHWQEILSNYEASGFIIWFVEVSPLINQIVEIKNQNQKINKEFSAYFELLDQINIPIWFRDADLNIRFYNKAYSQIALNNNKLDDFSHELAIEAEQLSAEAQSQIYLNVNGERKVFNTFENSNSSNILNAGYAIDITKIEQLKQEIKRHVSAQLDFISSSSSAIAIFSPDTHLTMWNNAFENLWQLDEKFLAKQPTYSEILEVLRQKRKLPEQSNFIHFKKAQIDLFKNLTSIHNEFFYLPEGKTLRVIVTPYALGGLLFAYEDITDKLALERSYNTLIAVLETTLDNLHESIVVYSSNGKLKLYNAVFSKLWRLDPNYLDSNPHFNDIIKQTEEFYQDKSDIEHYKNTFLSVSERRFVASSRVEMINGSVIDRIFVPLPDGSILITDLDTTDSVLVERSLRERNEALQETDRIKTAFLANISYQLRSPLTTIIGFADILLNGYFGKMPTKQEEYMSYIYTASKELMQLINDILDLALLDSGNIKLKVNQVNFVEVIESIIITLMNEFNNELIDIEMDLPEEELLIYIDHIRIKQALFNIINRIILSAEKDNKIVIRVTFEENFYHLVINDRKQFITIQEQQHFFDRFYKTPNDEINRKFANGLSLSIAKNIIELHSGKVELYSSIDTGIQIKISLPVAKESKDNFQNKAINYVAM